MKRNLNTSYRLVWNDVLGAFVAVSELAKAKGKRTGAVLAVTVAGLAGSAAALADGSNITVPEGESVTGVVVSNHDSHLVYGQAAGSIINTGQEYGMMMKTIRVGSLSSPAVWQRHPSSMPVALRRY